MLGHAGTYMALYSHPGRLSASAPTPAMGLGSVQPDWEGRFCLSLYPKPFRSLPCVTATPALALGTSCLGATGVLRRREQRDTIPLSDGVTVPGDTSRSLRKSVAIATGRCGGRHPGLAVLTRCSRMAFHGGRRGPGHGCCVGSQRESQPSCRGEQDAHRARHHHAVSPASAALAPRRLPAAPAVPREGSGSREQEAVSGSPARCRAACAVHSPCVGSQGWPRPAASCRERSTPRPWRGARGAVSCGGSSSCSSRQCVRGGDGVVVLGNTV